MKALLLAVLGWFVVVQIASAQTEGAQPTGRMLVGFLPNVSPQERARVLRGMGLSETAGVDLSEVFVEVAQTRPGLFRSASMEEVKSSPEVAVVEEDVYYPNWLLESQPQSMSQAFWPSMDEVREQIRSAAPSRPIPAVPVSFTTGASALREAADSIPWGVERVHAPEVWRAADSRSQGSGVRVAVLDTGIDCSHPDLQCDLTAGYNAVDSSQPPTDDNWHGTHVAAIIGAKHHTSGLVGVAPEVQLIAVKVLDKKGGSAVSDIIKGIVWTANHDVKIANMSFGAPISSSLMHLAIMYAHAKGVTMIAAAGNRGPAPDTVTYPAAYSEVISVAASGQNKDGSDSLPMFSSRGPQVAFIAPGANIFSAIPSGGYAYHSGTSMAAPHLTGLGAIAVAYGADGPDGVESAFKKAARPLPTLTRDEQGFGMVNAERLVPAGPALALNQ